MKIKAKITFQYHSEEEAKISLESLKPDDLGFIKSYRDNNCVICNLDGDSLRTILATADDLLFGEMMVEKVLDIKDLEGKKGTKESYK